MLTRDLQNVHSFASGKCCSQWVKHQTRTSAKGWHSSSSSCRGKSWIRVGWEQQKSSLQEKGETKRSLKLRSAFSTIPPPFLWTKGPFAIFCSFLPFPSLPYLAWEQGEGAVCSSTHRRHVGRRNPLWPGPGQVLEETTESHHISSTAGVESDCKMEVVIQALES